MASSTGGCGLLTLALAASLAASQPDVRGPAPTDAIGGIVGAFDAHAIVGLPDAHGNQQSHAFLLSLIRDPRFIRIVNDIVVEFGNARYQDVADRFVRGEEVPYESLRLVWRNHTQPSLSADFTHYEEFFRAVRAVNAAAPAGRTLRVLLGDPPIDWDAVRNKDDHFKWIEMRDAHPAAILQTEVIARGHRALLIYGTGHLQRKNVLSNFEMNDWRAQTIVSLVERAGPTRVLTIAGVDGRHAAGWKAPALARIQGTALGALDASEYFGGRGRFTVRDGKLVAVRQEEWRPLRADEQFDALLYLGVPAAAGGEPLSPDLCTEPGYVEMRLERIALAGLPPPEVERVTRLCGGKGR